MAYKYVHETSTGNYGLDIEIFDTLKQMAEWFVKQPDRRSSPKLYRIETD